ncbi:MAG: SpoIIE family protein phosphatase [Acidobacteriales bacterium]|nr:SpoIIE family protein phosphatase [Terriglobales bacterium]
MKLLPIRYARRKLFDRGLIPRSRLSILTLYLAGVTLLLYLLQKGFQLFSNNPSAGADIGAWFEASKFFLIVLLLVLALRYARTRLMWRLRNRLLVTYVFIGVIPVVLVVTMALLAGFLFAGQFATYLATTDLGAELTRLETLNAAVAADFASDLRRTNALSAQNLNELKARHLVEGRFGNVEVAAWLNDTRVVLRDAGLPPEQSAPPGWVEGRSFSNTALLDRQLFLVAYRRVRAKDRHAIVMSRERIDPELLNRIGQNFQEISFLLGSSGVVVLDGEQRQFGVARRSPHEQRSDPNPNPNIEGQWNISGGQVSTQGGWFDRNVYFVSLYPAVDWKTGARLDVPMRVHTRVSLLYQRLFSNFSQFANTIRNVLIAVAVIFGIIELFALFIGLGLTRTITRSIAALYTATQRVNRGDLRHRIVVRSRDQLAELEKSFNSMIDSLERLLAEQKEKQRIENELAIAHEVQAQLFPREETQLRTLELHGVCRPARTVSGDYYDFLPVGYDKLVLALGDISGKGISAALLMATVHSAVRAFQLNAASNGAAFAEPVANIKGGGKQAQGSLMLRSEKTNGDVLPSPRQLLWMLNRHLHRSTQEEKYATLFLGAYDGPSRTLTYSNAGHLPPLVIGAGGETRRLSEGGTVLGLFEDVEHDEGRVVLAPGDLFIAYSDGITEPENEFGEFGEVRLLEIVREHRGLPLARLSEAVITAVEDWIGAGEQPDDVTLVLARVREH